MRQTTGGSWKPVTVRSLLQRNYRCVFRQGEFPDHFEDIRPFSIADDASLRQVATRFPGSVGTRVLKWRHVEILYPNQKELSAYLRYKNLFRELSGV